MTAGAEDRKEQLLFCLRGSRRQTVEGILSGTKQRKLIDLTLIVRVVLIRRADSVHLCLHDRQQNILIKDITCLL